MFDMLKENFPVLIFSCVQLSSKLSFLTQVHPACSFFDKVLLNHSLAALCLLLKKTSFQRIDNDTAVRFLHSVGHSVSKQALLESELMVLKVLEFRINDPNPLTYVEVLLEVLGETLRYTNMKKCFPSTHNGCVFTLELRAELLSLNLWRKSNSSNI